MQFIKKCSPNFQKFFHWSLKTLEKHDKTVTICNTKTVNCDGTKVGGWCNDREIVIAFKNQLFEQTYVHEFSHMQQCVENSPYWKDTSLFWRHLEKDKIAINSWDAVSDVISLERDCERRSILHSKKWGLFDNEEYAKNANLYLHFYQFVFLKRKWPNFSSIYHPLITQKMPDKLLPTSHFRHIDMNLMGLFEDCLDKKGKFYKI